MPPIPCSKCGINFMKQDQNPETPNLCNNCIKPEKKPIDEITILIKCDAETQKMIEEICINEGISFSEYFLKLHNNHWGISENSHITTKVVYPLPNLSKIPMTDTKLPKGFGEVNLPEDSNFSSVDSEDVKADEPKKRGRPFKNR